MAGRVSARAPHRARRRVRARATDRARSVVVEDVAPFVPAGARSAPDARAVPDRRRAEPATRLDAAPRCRPVTTARRGGNAPRSGRRSARPVDGADVSSCRGCRRVRDAARARSKIHTDSGSRTTTNAASTATSGAIVTPAATAEERLAQPVDAVVRREAAGQQLERRGEHRHREQRTAEDRRGLDQGTRQRVAALGEHGDAGADDPERAERRERQQEQRESTAAHPTTTARRRTHRSRRRRRARCR